MAPGVRPISEDGLHHLGVDAKGQLYWDGKQVSVRNRFSFERFERRLAAIAAFATVIAAIAAAVSAYSDYHMLKLSLREQARTSAEAAP